MIYLQPAVVDTAVVGIVVVVGSMFVADTLMYYIVFVVAVQLLQ